MIRLDCNELPWELPEELKQEALGLLLGVSWNRYPSIDADPIREKLSVLMEWPKQQIFVGNGSDELLQAVFIGLDSLFDTVVIPAPSFSMYKLLALRFDKQVKEIFSSLPAFAPDINHIKLAASDPRSLLFICHPNNPTGRAWSAQELAEVLSVAQGLVIIDEAYTEFFANSSFPYLQERCVVLRTLSKALGAAGLRFGYALTSLDIAKEFGNGLLPYHVNALTQVLAEYYISQKRLIAEYAYQIRLERENLSASLSTLAEIQALPSDANFILFKVGNAFRVWEELRSRGVYIRRFLDGQLSEYLRVTVGQKHENEVFIRALKEILGRNSA